MGRNDKSPWLKAGEPPTNSLDPQSDQCHGSKLEFYTIFGTIFLIESQFLPLRIVFNTPPIFMEKTVS